MLFVEKIHKNDGQNIFCLLCTIRKRVLGPRFSLINVMVCARPNIAHAVIIMCYWPNYHIIKPRPHQHDSRYVSLL